MAQNPEDFMVPVERRVRPLVDVLVELFGFEKAADKLHGLYLVEQWPACEGEHKCGKNGCGGDPRDLFSPKQIETVRGWYETCRAAHKEGT